MNRNIDYYSRGIANAFARRQAAQERKHPHKASSNAITITSTKISDEQFKTITIEKMITHIRKKEKTQ